jgi:bacterioferritin
MTTLTTDQTTEVRQQLINGLNQDLAGEYQAIIVYIQYAAMTTGLDRLQLEQFLSSQIPDETAHAQFLAQKISALGGVPTTEPRAVPGAETNREIVENVLEAVRQTIATYTERVQQADACGDIALRAELETQIHDETRHAEELEKTLRNWRD